MHLAANSIGHWLADFMGEDVYQVTHFYDEVLSHYIWHLGTAALSAQLIYRSWRYPFEEISSRLILEITAGIIYGVTIFIIGIEGGTVILLFPFSILTAILSLVLGWKMLRNAPVLTFFLVGYTLAAILFAGWGIFWGYFPQFSQLGWI